MREAMLIPEGKWFCYPRTPCDYQKRSVSRRVCDSGPCQAGAEQKRIVAGPSADSCSWISHMKQGRWKAEEQAAQSLLKRGPIRGRQRIMMTSQKTVRCQMRTGDKR